MNKLFYLQATISSKISRVVIARYGHNGDRRLQIWNHVHAFIDKLLEEVDLCSQVRLINQSFEHSRSSMSKVDAVLCRVIRVEISDPMVRRWRFYTKK